MSVIADNRSHQRSTPRDEVKRRMLIVAGTLAIVFFEPYNKVGLRVLRSTWINFDLLWAVALLVAGCIVLLELLRTSAGRVRTGSSHRTPVSGPSIQG